MISFVETLITLNLQWISLPAISSLSLCHSRPSCRTCSKFHRNFTADSFHFLHRWISSSWRECRVKICERPFCWVLFDLWSCCPSRPRPALRICYTALLCTFCRPLGFVAHGCSTAWNSHRRTSRPRLFDQRNLKSWTDRPIPKCLPATNFDHWFCSWPRPHQPLTVQELHHFTRSWHPNRQLPLSYWLWTFMIRAVQFLVLLGSGWSWEPVPHWMSHWYLLISKMKMIYDSTCPHAATTECLLTALAISSISFSKYIINN